MPGPAEAHPQRPNTLLQSAADSKSPGSFGNVSVNVSDQLKQRIYQTCGESCVNSFCFSRVNKSFLQLLTATLF
ncbi:Hypothetical predicted protein [Podarcis lilfordi]|uniref:Uncharacterized protein n=1 Tax=Podarcis lilfordi TaxID=74358 RepID=A0AA35JTL6_9SAUR|nr:Hypothetical predicted protein [Podarcis lilfordi]